MTERLRRGSRFGRSAASAHQVHLGLGNFFRAHQAVYTDRSPDRDMWGTAAFTGRSPVLAASLSEQDGLYTLIDRSASGDRLDVVGSISRACAADDHDAWIGHVRSADTRLITLTVTEAAYHRSDAGGLRHDDPRIRADIAALSDRSGSLVRSVPGRLVAGLAARREDGVGRLAVVSCDNLAGNGAALATVVGEMAARVDDSLAGWIHEHVAFPATMVDRITPRTTAADLDAVTGTLGIEDRCPVVAEPFSEWVLQDRFPAGRPRWEEAGAQFTDDVEPFERRKLWLLNGAHSLLAYTGSIRGHTTVADAVRDETCLQWMQQWWSEACGHLELPAEQLRTYCDALLERFANPAMQHLLAQIAADGSEKLRMRTVPVLARERARGTLPLGATRTLAAWLLNLRGSGAPVADAHAHEVTELAAGPLSDAVARTLSYLDPELGEDASVRAAVAEQAAEMRTPHDL